LIIRKLLLLRNVPSCSQDKTNIALKCFSEPRQRPLFTLLSRSITAGTKVKAFIHDKIICFPDGYETKLVNGKSSHTVNGRYSTEQRQTNRHDATTNRKPKSNGHRQLADQNLKKQDPDYEQKQGEKYVYCHHQKKKKGQIAPLVAETTHSIITEQGVGGRRNALMPKLQHCLYISYRCSRPIYRRPNYAITN
jgi:hypothetical protein